LRSAAALWRRMAIDTPLRDHCSTESEAKTLRHLRRGVESSAFFLRPKPMCCVSIEYL